MWSRANIDGLLVPAVLALYAFINLTISKMTVGGVAINIIGLFLLSLCLVRLMPKTLLAFFAINAMLGPFLFVNFRDAGLLAVGRMDFALALLVGAALLVREGRISRAMLGLSILYGVLFVWGLALCLQAGDPLLAFLDNWYSIAGRLAVGILMFHLLGMLGHPRAARWTGWLLMLVLCIHLSFSWLQLMVPVTLRAGAIDAGLNLLGFTLNRPMGLLEASYVYGVTTIGLWWVWDRFAGADFPRLSILLFLLMVPMAIIATRSVAVGILLYIGLTYLGTARGVYRALISLVLVTAVVLALRFLELATMFDQSNSTKILLAWTTIATWVGDFPSWYSFLGYGYGKAGQLAATSDFFDLAYSLGATYDNRIDNGDGFPIHNVFLQFFFEFGLLATIVGVWLLWRGLRNILRRRLDRSTVFFWCIAVTHFAVHNGIFSPWLTLALLLAAFPNAVSVMRFRPAHTPPFLNDQRRVA